MSQLASPMGIRRAPNGNLYVVDTDCVAGQEPGVNEYNVGTGAFIRHPVLDTPSAMAAVLAWFGVGC